MTAADLTAWNARNRLARAEYRLNAISSFGVSGPCRVCGRRTTFLSGVCRLCLDSTEGKR